MVRCSHKKLKIIPPRNICIFQENTGFILYSLFTLRPYTATNRGQACLLWFIKGFLHIYIKNKCRVSLKYINNNYLKVC